MRSPRLLTAVFAIALGAGPAAAQSAPPPRIEVAFALDATGSMGSYIAEARAKIRAIAAELATGSPKPDVRFALVTFRDKTDDYVTKIHPFGNDVDAMYRALDQTSASGGGDEPEAVLEGVRDALTGLGWTPPEDDGVIRLVYLVGDAPPQHYADSPTEAFIAAEARRRHISIHGLVCGERAGRTEAEFEALARHTEGRLFRLRDAKGRPGVDRASSLAGALAGTTKAYSSSIGVAFGTAGAAEVPTAPLAVPAVATTGLLGAHVRWVRDASTWRDLWETHMSLSPAAARAPAPAVDFEQQHVLVLGGSGGGLVLEALLLEKEQRAARVRPAADKSVRFLLVPAQGATGAR